MKNEKKRIISCRRRKRIYVTMAVVMVAITSICLIHSAVQNKKLEEYEKQSEELSERMLQIDKQVDNRQQDKEPDRYTVFDSMPDDYESVEESFVFYEIPEEYSRTGGYFPEDMQRYTYCICKEYGVRYDLVIAVIERESGYVFDKVGDSGHSIGYMQIYEKYHRDRMKRLNCTDLTNPYQNVLVGIDYLSELIERYGTIQDALAAYNYGEQMAKQHLWQKGMYVYDYNQSVMNRMKEIEEELEHEHEICNEE